MLVGFLPQLSQQLNTSTILDWPFGVDADFSRLGWGQPTEQPRAPAGFLRRAYEAVVVKLL